MDKLWLCAFTNQSFELVLMFTEVEGRQDTKLGI